MRPTTMKRSVVLSCSALLLVAGCGTAGSGAGSGAGSAPSGGTTKQPPAASQKIGACAPDAPGVTRATTLTKADLDGDGTPEDVRLTSPDGSCPNVVFAKAGAGFLSAQVPTDGPPVTKAAAVSVPGTKAQLLSTRQTHPRGGFQLRVFAVSGGTLKELTDAGAPLVPFVATDVQETHVSLSCGQGGLVKTQAVAHEPHGIAFAWDVKRTTYTLTGGALKAGPTEEVADNVLPAQLDKKFPELADSTMFRGCA